MKQKMENSHTETTGRGKGLAETSEDRYEQRREEAISISHVVGAIIAPVRKHGYTLFSKSCYLSFLFHPTQACFTPTPLAIIDKLAT